MIKMWIFYYYLPTHSDDKSYLEIYASLYAEYKYQGILRFTTLIMYLRVTLVLIFLVGGSENALAQSVGFFSCNLLVLLWHCICRPAETIFKNVMNIFKEFLILAISKLYIGMVTNIVDKDQLGLSIVLLMIIISSLEIVTMLVEFIQMLIEWRQECRKNAELQKCTPYNDDSKQEVRPEDIVIDPIFNDTLNKDSSAMETEDQNNSRRMIATHIINRRRNNKAKKGRALKRFGT